MDTALTAEEQIEIVAQMNRLDPKHERITIDENWVICVFDGWFVGWLHPRTFLDLAREDFQCLQI